MYLRFKKSDLLMLKILLTPITVSLLVMAIPTIAFEDPSSKVNIKYELNANLDELVLTYCNTYDSYTVAKLYSEKDVLKNDIIRKNKNPNIIVKIKNKPLDPKSVSKIKVFNQNIEKSNFTEMDLDHLNNTKKNFVRTVLPLIINENQKIISLRSDLYSINNKLLKNNTISNNEIKLLKKLSRIYNVNFDNQHKSEIINKLLNKIDIIPNSVVLAQAAIESGWGTSRFAKEYNALFGEYTYDNNKGVIPLERKNGEKHLIKSFTSYNNSVASYFNNINSHYAYKEFRNLRSVMRDRNNFTNVKLLVEKLDTYAEDTNYIKTIKAVINKNKFNKFDLKQISY